MKTRTTRSWTIAGIVALVSLTLCAIPGLTHHSFAMYDQAKTVTLTGVVTRFVAQANHAEIHFYAVGPDGKLMKDSEGKYVSWGVEMAGAAAVAEQGITAATFGAGTVFSVKLNPLRDGTNYGSRIGAIAMCPIDATTGKPKPPASGKHCDSVPGNKLMGGAAF
jgi:hypothetical protein